MGATASVNATSRKYKSSEPIEVKFHNVVKYDDGDEKPFKDKYQLANKKQPLQPFSLLSSAIRILERKPKGEPIPNGHLPKQYVRQVRPRSAYMILKKGSQASSTHSTSNQHGMSINGLEHTKLSPGQKQHKTKQSLYLSLINPAMLAFQDRSFQHNGMSMPHRIHPPMKYAHPKSNTSPGSNQHGGKKLKMNHKLYMDMIRPVMSSPQYSKIRANQSILGMPFSQRTISRQSHSNQTLTPRPPNESQSQKRLHPNLLRVNQQREACTQQRETYTPRRKEPTPQTSMRSDHSSSVSNGFLAHKDILHLPRLTKKTKDRVSLNSRTTGQIPQAHPGNVIPLYFSKSLAYSPQYKRRELLSNPL